MESKTCIHYPDSPELDPRSPHDHINTIWMGESKTKNGLPRWLTAWRIRLPIQDLQKMQNWNLGQEDFPGGGNGNPLQYSCLGNPMDRGACRVTVHGVIKELDMTEHTNRQDWELEWKELPYPKYLWLISNHFKLYKDWWPWVHRSRASLRALDTSCLSERPWNLTLRTFLSTGMLSIHHNLLSFNFECLILLCHKSLECSRFT